MLIVPFLPLLLSSTSTPPLEVGGIEVKPLAFEGALLVSLNSRGVSPLINQSAPKARRIPDIIIYCRHTRTMLNEGQ